MRKDKNKTALYVSIQARSIQSCRLSKMCNTELKLYSPTCFAPVGGNPLSFLTKDTSLHYSGKVRNQI